MDEFEQRFAALIAKARDIRSQQTRAQQAASEARQTRIQAQTTHLVSRLAAAERAGNGDIEVPSARSQNGITTYEIRWTSTPPRRGLRVAVQDSTDTATFYWLKDKGTGQWAVADQIVTAWSDLKPEKIDTTIEQLADQVFWGSGGMPPWLLPAREERA